MTKRAIVIAMLSGAALLAQRPQCIERAFLNRVGDRDEPGRTAVDRNQHHDLTFFAKFFCALDQAVHPDAERTKKGQVANRDPPAVDRTDHPLSGFGAEIGNAGEPEPAFLSPLDERGSQRVLAAALQTSGKTQHFVLIDRSGRNDGDQFNAKLVSSPASIVNSPTVR